MNQKGGGINEIDKLKLKVIRIDKKMVDIDKLL